MKILIIEDDEKNIKAAKKQLSEHDLKIISGYDEVYKCFQKKIDKEKMEDYLKKNLPNDYCPCPENTYFWMDSNMYFTPNGCKTNEWGLPDHIKVIIQEAKSNSLFDPFDVVLIDVNIPKGGNNCCVDDGKVRPYGPIIALRAISIGIKKIGLLTSGNHHTDPIVYAFDDIPNFNYGELKIVCSNQMDLYVETTSYEEVFDNCLKRYQKGEVILVKNWKKLLSQLF